MFPKSRESAIEKISEQLGGLQGKIKERVEDLERRIRLLSEIRESHEGLIKDPCGYGSCRNSVKIH